LPPIDVEPQLYAAVMAAVERQVSRRDPPEVHRTYERLRAAGEPDRRARQMIAFVFSLEILRVLHTHGRFDGDRYIRALRRLPRLPRLPYSTG
jgi:hypothetical protein